MKISKEDVIRTLKNQVCSTCSFYREKAYSRKPGHGSFEWCWKKQDVPAARTCEDWEKADEGATMATSYNPNAGTMTLTVSTDVKERKDEYRTLLNETLNLAGVPLEGNR